VPNGDHYNEGVYDWESDGRVTTNDGKEVLSALEVFKRRQKRACKELTNPKGRKWLSKEEKAAHESESTERGSESF